MSNNIKTEVDYKHIDNLPDSANVRMPTVLILLGVSKATVWRRVAAGDIKTYKLTPRTTTFNLGELREYIAKLKAANDPSYDDQETEESSQQDNA